MKNTENQIICDICGCIIEDDQTWNEVDGRVYCEHCLDEAHEHGTVYCCPECGETHEITNMQFVRNIGEYICNDCIDNDGFYYCEECSEYHYNTYDYSAYRSRASWYYEMIVTNNGTVMCHRAARDNGYRPCYNCSVWMHEDDMSYDDDEAEYYCPSCYHELEKSRLIHKYGYKPSPKFKCSPHDEFWTDVDIKELLFGVELEVDDGTYEPETLAEEILGWSDDVYCKHDGSLDEGVEIVTHPATLDYHLNELAWKEITQACRRFGFKSHNTTTCGLHVHVGRRQLFDDWTLDQDKVLANLIVLLSRFRKEITVFTRRRSGSLDHWAEMPRDIPQNITCENDLVHWALNDSWSSMYSRYHALNLQNNNTVEFRIFRGTLNLDTIKATLQFVSNMCKFAKDHTPTQCVSCQFSALVEYVHYDELSDYVATRGIELDEFKEPFRYAESDHVESNMRLEVAMDNAVACAEIEDDNGFLNYCSKSPDIFDVVKFHWYGYSGVATVFGVVTEKDNIYGHYTIKVAKAIGDEDAVKDCLNAKHPCMSDNAREYLYISRNSLSVVSLF